MTVELPLLLGELLDQLEPSLPAIRRARDLLALDAEISAYIELTDESPIGTLPWPLVRRIAAFEADLDLDLYPGVSDDSPEHAG